MKCELYLQFPEQLLKKRTSRYIEHILHLNSILMYAVYVCIHKIYMWIYFSDLSIPIICQFCKLYWCVQFSMEQFRVWFEKKCMNVSLYEYVFDILSFDNLLKVISVTFWSLKLKTVIFRFRFLITYLKYFSLKGKCIHYCIVVL